MQCAVIASAAARPRVATSSAAIRARSSGGRPVPTRPSRKPIIGRPARSTSWAAARNSISSPNCAASSWESAVHPTHASIAV